MARWNEHGGSEERLAGRLRAASGMRWCCIAAVLVAVSTGIASAETFDVQLIGSAFQPANLTIQVGDSVRFRNMDSMPHNVKADNGSFRCATGCDTGGGGPDTGYDPGTPPDSPGDPVGGNWSFTRTFNTAGDVRYYCEVHGGPGGSGMSGRIVVQAGGGGGNAGQTRFTADRFMVSESAGNASVTVERAGGTFGAVTVTVSTGTGSASAGADFQAVSQVVSWGDGASAVHTIQVPILDDTAREGTEIVNLTLSSPTGGVTLGSPTSAELRILDNEEPTGGGSSAGSLRFETTRLWTFEDGGELALRVLREGGKSGAVSVPVAAAGGGATAGSDFGGAAGTLTWGNGDDAPKTVVLDPVDDGRGEGTEKVVIALGTPSGGAGLASGSTATVFLIERPTSCSTGGHDLCLGDRFVVSMAFATTGGQSGEGNAVQLTTDSGYFTFFDPNNVEAVVKVLNACVINQRFWVFGAGLTDVEVDLSVVDTHASTAAVYSNPLGTPFAPVTDVQAFATCTH